MENPQELSTDSYSSLISLSRSKSFLGQDFLLWLWFRSETDSKFSMAQTADEIEFWIDDRLELATGSGQSQLMKGGNPSQSYEVGVALSKGKVAKEIKFGVSISNLGEFSCLLNHEDLNPRSLKIPDPPPMTSSEHSGESVVAFRLRAVQSFIGALDHLFSMFIEDRTNDWEQIRLVEIRKWIKTRGDGENYLDTLH